jgi:sulfate transport system substrate-binding protein
LAVLTIAAFACWRLLGGAAAGADDKLLHVSYDPTRELWRAINAEFVADYRDRTGRTVAIRQSHSSSGSQARAVMEGLPADVTSLALFPDVDAIRGTGLIADDWNKRLPHGAAPFYSTIVFVVRKGNPHGVRDWGDLVDPGRELKIVAPNPKTSGNGKYAFLAAWGGAKAAKGKWGDPDDFVRRLYERMPVLDASARACTSTFSQKRIGDVHLAFESEAFLEVHESGGELEIVYPASGSIRVEPPVAWVDENCRRRGTTALAEEYLRFAYEPKAQALAAELGFRPTHPAVKSDRFPAIRLFVLADAGLTWESAMRDFFTAGALFDRISQDMAKGRR